MPGATQQIAWNRILAEGAAIVGGILLAFAIDAWWQQRAEDANAAALVAGMHADFEASQAHLEEWRRGVNQSYAHTQQFLNTVRAAEIGSDIEVPVALLVGTVGSPTYSPTDSTLRAALASGHLEIIENDELLNQLSLWRQLLADTSEDELLVREIIVDHLVPELAEYARLGAAFEYETHMGQFLNGASEASRELVRIRVTSGLEGQLAQRHFYSRFVVQGFDQIYAAQDEILALLNQMRQAD